MGSRGGGGISTGASEHYEVSPMIQRVACINGPHLKQMAVLEALTNTLGWAYNYHKPQVVWALNCAVKVEGHKVRRVRGHTSHTAYPHTAPPALTTELKVGTYLTFYVERLSEVRRCSLVMEGVEAVHKTGGKHRHEDEVMKNKIWVERVNTNCSSQPPLSEQCHERLGLHHCTNQAQEFCVSSSKAPLRRKRVSGGHSLRRAQQQRSSNTIKQSLKYKVNLSNTPTQHSEEDTTQGHHQHNIPDTAHTDDNYLASTSAADSHEDHSGVIKKGLDSSIYTQERLMLDLSCTEEVTDILSGSSSEDSEWEEVDQDDICKVVRKTVTCPITELVCPRHDPTEAQQQHTPSAAAADDGSSRVQQQSAAGTVIILLLRPATPQQAWHFQSAHLNVWYQRSERNTRMRLAGGSTTNSTRTRTAHSVENEECKKDASSNDCCKDKCRRPPQRTRLTYHTAVKPITAVLRNREAAKAH